MISPTFPPLLDALRQNMPPGTLAAFLEYAAVEVIGDREPWDEPRPIPEPWEDEDAFDEPFAPGELPEELPEIVHDVTRGTDGGPSINSFPEGWTWEDEERCSPGPPFVPPFLIPAGVPEISKDAWLQIDPLKELASMVGEERIIIAEVG